MPAAFVTDTIRELGCYKRGPDKRFAISADAPVRKDLLIPRLFEKAGFATDKTYTLRVSKKESPPKQFAACARVRGVCFKYDKSFIRPTVVDDLEILNQLAKKHPDSKVMIFGHTDKVGPGQYNKDLSERRALSTYAFITNDADAWEKLYHDENWGIRAVQAILNDLGGDFDPGKERASKVTLEVYASNYCNAQENDDGTLAFTRLASPVPVFARDLPDEFARPGEEHEITDWHGEVTAADGVLKVTEGKERRVNAAFSPYTVHLRYLEKGAADTEARILLEDFWPRWKKQGGADALQADSLKLRWRIEKTEVLKVGKLLIVDKPDAVVFEKDLAEADLKKGEFDWDGMTLAGTEASSDQMPYRVQIQARTGDGEAKGLAVAAMHTEIRIFVDSAIHLDSDQDYDPAGDPQAFDIGLGPLILQPEAPARDRGTIWCQHRLARSGFHPGPGQSQPIHEQGLRSW